MQGKRGEFFIKKSQKAYPVVDILIKVWYNENEPTPKPRASEQRQKRTEPVPAVLESDLAKEIIVKMKPSNSSK